MNYYPEQLKVILVYIEALNVAENAITNMKCEYSPYAKEIALTSEDGTDFGYLRDEIGGSWSWTPAKGKS